MLFKLSKFIKRIFSGSNGFISTNELSVGPQATIIDLRRPDELLSTGIIKNSLIKDFHDEDFHQFLSTLDPKQKYIVYCKAGGRSAKAAAYMRSLGLSVRDYSPGMDGWLKNKLPTKKYQT